MASVSDAHGNTLLGAAIGAGDLGIVMLLVEKGADIDYVNHGGHGALDAAVYRGQDEIAAFLIGSGLAPSIHHHAALGDVEAISTLARREPHLLGVTPAGGRWRMTPLHAAAIGVQARAAEHLLELGVDVNAEDHNGHTALARVIEVDRGHPRFGGRLGVANLLVDAGADVDCLGGHFGGEILHRAIIHNDRELAHLLLESGADPNAVDGSGKSALHHAGARSVKMVELVLGDGPDLEITTIRRAKPGGGEIQSETALAMAERLGKSAAIKLIEAIC